MLCAADSPFLRVFNLTEGAGKKQISQSKDFPLSGTGTAAVKQSRNRGLKAEPGPRPLSRAGTAAVKWGCGNKISLQTLNPH